MGGSAARRPGAVRAAVPRGRAGRAELGNGAEEAGRLPGRVRRVRPGGGGRVRRGADRCAGGRPGDRAPPRQDRGGGEQCAGGPGGAARGGEGRSGGGGGRGTGGAADGTGGGG